MLIMIIDICVMVKLDPLGELRYSVGGELVMIAFQRGRSGGGGCRGGRRDGRSCVAR
jgi:hypothetical protein